MKRRDFLARSACAATGAGALHVAGFSLLSGCADAEVPMAAPLFSISLAEWSLNRALKAGEMTNLDFPVITRQRFDLEAVEYVNQFFDGSETDAAYLTELKSRCDGEGVQSLLIMCDGEGMLGDPDDARRTTAVENHYRWIDTAKFLGCHSIRVNAASAGTWDEQRDLAADGLSRLTEFGNEHDINVIVENHGGLSSNGEWLSAVMQQVNMDRCGTLPDFGNFQTEPDVWYDRYRGVEELMPYAKAVSAKTYDFDENGSDTMTDYGRMMKIVLDAGYRGHIGIEYEGKVLGEDEGIRATIALLVRVREELTAQYG